MKRAIAAAVALLAACAPPAGAQQAEPASMPAPAPSLDLSTRPQPVAPVVTDEVIKKAVRETIADDPHPPPAANQQAGVLRTGAVSMEERMTAAFNDAKVPDCLHDDALKLQPAHIGPIGVVGPLSLPWVIAAVVRGKCHQ